MIAAVSSQCLVLVSHSPNYVGHGREVFVNNQAIFSWREIHYRAKLVCNDCEFIIAVFKICINAYNGTDRETNVYVRNVFDNPSIRSKHVCYKHVVLYLVVICKNNCFLIHEISI